MQNFRGKDINYVKPQNGLNVLMSYLNYAKKPESDVVSHFISAGINVNQRDALGWTAYLYAANKKPFNL